MEKLSQYKD